MTAGGAIHGRVSIEVADSVCANCKITISFGTRCGIIIQWGSPKHKSFLVGHCQVRYQKIRYWSQTSFYFLDMDVEYWTVFLRRVWWTPVGY
jgi:hypothetical protein